MGTLPADQQPMKVVTQTPAHLEAEYAPKRAHIIDVLDPLLNVNSKFTGFCSDPLSIVELSVLPCNQRRVFRAQYSLARSLYVAIDDVIQRWLQQGKITRDVPRGTIYNSPLLAAPKKDEHGKLTGVRVCIDVRLLNQYLVENDRFALPRIPDLLSAFAGKSIFGEFDLSEAFTQFRLSPTSQPYTAFMWDDQQYMFVGCPYGIKHIPSLFQRYMAHLFRDMPFVFPYIDNIAFASSTWEEHERHALAIVHRLNSVNLKIKPSSVNLGNHEIKLLGHIINKSGIGIDPEKRDMILQWPRPLTGTELASALGLGSFLRDHIRGYADITAPLERVKRQKDIDWASDPTLDQSWQAFKRAFSIAPILRFPDLNKRICVAHDASQTGVGCLLYQPDDDDDTITKDNIIGIYSKQLNPAQQRYPVYKKELWGLVCALRKFHPILWGRRDVVVYTDHKPLEHIMKQTSLSVSLQQWVDLIWDYNFTVKHRPGVLHVQADALSRMYMATYGTDDGSAQVWGTKDNVTLLKNFQRYSSPSDYLCQQSINEVKPPNIVTKRHRPQSAKPSQGGGGERGSESHALNMLATIFASENDNQYSSCPLFYACENYFVHTSKYKGMYDTLNHYDALVRERGRERFKPPVSSLFNLVPSERPRRSRKQVVDYHDPDLESALLRSRMTHPPPAAASSPAPAAAVAPSPVSPAVAAPAPAVAVPVLPVAVAPAPALASPAVSVNDHDIDVDDVPDSSRRRVAFVDSSTSASSPLPSSTSSSSPSPAAADSDFYEFNNDDTRYVLDVDAADEPRQPVDDDDDVDDDDERADSQENAPADTGKNDVESLSDRQLIALARKGCTVPPASERRSIIQRAHMMGHFGRRPMASRIIRSGKFWPSLHADIRREIESCAECQRSEVGKSGFHPARTIDALLPGDHYQIDLATMPLSEAGHKYMFVLVDVFSGFVVLRPLKTKSAVSIARVLWEICSIIGFPRILQSDNGKEFVNGIVRALVSMHGIQHRTIAAYNPRSDGKVERSVRTIKLSLQKLLQGADVFWPLHLPFVQFSYNDKVQDITGATAFSVMFGRLPNEPVNYNTTHRDIYADAPVATDAWRQHQERLVSLIFPAISARRKDVQEKYRQRMDRVRRRVVSEALPPGTKVMIKDPLYLANSKMRPSSEPAYIGPYTVVRQSPYGPYHLLDDLNEPYSRPVPLDQMKIVRAERSADDADGEVAEVQRILNHRTHRTTNQLMYRVEWKDGSRNQWVPADGFHDTAIVTRYWKEREAVKRATSALRRDGADKNDDYDD